MKRKANVVLILVFGMILVLPYLFAHRNPEERISSQENRMLAGYPSIRSENGEWNQNYIAEYEDWLKDNLRGRTLMVEGNSWLQYRLFQRIVKEDVLMGRNHWLFVNDTKLIEEYQHVNLLSSEELTQYTEKMQKLSDWLEAKGIGFYYFQCYNKESIYPQEYAEGIHAIGEISRADQVVQALTDSTDISVIHSKEILEKAAAERLIYFQYTDLHHWNQEGAYIGYRTLLDEIHEDYEQVSVLQKEDYNIQEIPAETEIYGVKYDYSEICPIYDVAFPNAVEITEETREKWNFLFYKEHTHEYQNLSGANDLKILLVGDSFIRQFIKDDIAEGFASTLSIDWLNIPILDKVIKEYQPDIVVLESAQSALGNTIQMIRELDFVD